MPTEIVQPFRPRARILQLLGDELIGSTRLAVFELVKNAYDADASEVLVSINVTLNEPVIIVADDGEGMSLDVLRSVWLVPGDNHRQKQRKRRLRSPKHNRLPLGEKGLGRFAVHKLGNRIRLTTRAHGSEECVVEINWNDLIAKPYLEDAPVKIITRPAEVFTHGKTGTHIEIQELRPPEWTRGEIRSLYTQITSICSPFREPSAFRAVLTVPGHGDWIEDLPDFSAILERALWKFDFLINNGSIDWKYEFRQVPELNLDQRQVSKNGDQLQLPKTKRSDKQDDRVVAKITDLEGIGPILGEFHVFDRDRELLRRMGDTRLMTSYLDRNGGIRVYRDGIRVYNYGEQGDDWLGLDLRRVNIPTRKISNNLMLGAIHLKLDSSYGLVEKTNREGFVENDTFARLQRVVLGALGKLESERQVDKSRIRQLIKAHPDPAVTGIEKPIQDLRDALAKYDVPDSFENHVKRIERHFVDMQETLLSAGMSGLNLAVIFHEVERGVRALHKVIIEGQDMDGARRQIQELVKILDGFSTLLRRSSKKQYTSKELISAAKQFNSLRFRYHGVEFSCPPLEDVDLNFKSSYSFGLILGALNNLIDNSLYWLRVRWPENGPISRRCLFVGTSNNFARGPAIVVADNGPGFQGDSSDLLIRPFFTRKPDGMGLGLYYANLAMELNGGYLAFPRSDEVEISDEFDGAVVALIFKANK